MRHTSGSSRWMIAMALLIVYGSLYPFQFHRADFSIDQLARLAPYQWLEFEDAVVNFLLYLPFGAAVFFFAAEKSRAAVYGLAAVLGALLSGVIEILQLFEYARTGSLADIVINSASAAAGAALAGAYADSKWFRARVEAAFERDQIALVLMVVFVCWLVFPGVPSISPAKQKVERLMDPSTVTLLALMASAVNWLAAAELLERLRVRARMLWLLGGTGLLFAQCLIYMRNPTMAAWMGALGGVATHRLLRRVAGRWTVLVCAGAVCGGIAVRGAAPFALAATGAGFAWLPFGAVLEAAWIPAAVVILEKIFLYGTAIYFLDRAQVRLAYAAAAVATLLAMIEAIQRYLPGRTPESTDPVLAILLALGFSRGRKAEAKSEAERDFPPS